MGGRFFIVGLPRSRTAWFSVAATTPTSVCFHEPTCRIQSFAELRAFWAPKFGVDIGISDSALAPQICRILAELAPRTLIIEREIEDVTRSFMAYIAKTSLHGDEGRCRSFAALALAELAKAKDNPLVKTVAYDSLSDMETVREALTWLLPGRDFHNLPALMGMNIQVDRAHIEATANLPHTGWYLTP